MNNIIQSIMSNLSESDKKRMGQGGSKVNKDGAHLLTITEAYLIDTRFVLKCEDTEGKSIDATMFLQKEVGEKDGVVQVGEYSVNGVMTQLNNKGDKYDDLYSLGMIKNLWTITGNAPEAFGQGMEAGTVTYANAGVKEVNHMKQLIGKQFTAVSQYEISMDKNGKKAWRNQKLLMSTLFNAQGFTAAEAAKGATETTKLNESVAWAVANPKIKFSDQNNKIAITELKLIQVKGTTPTVTNKAVADDQDEDIFS